MFLVRFFIFAWAVLAGKRWFRAAYPNGQYSERMTHGEARDYVKIFGGKVIEDKP